jgi:hypothetical protein
LFFLFSLSALSTFTYLLINYKNLLTDLLKNKLNIGEYMIVVLIYRQIFEYTLQSFLAYRKAFNSLGGELNFMQKIRYQIFVILSILLILINLLSLIINHDCF